MPTKVPNTATNAHSYSGATLPAPPNSEKLGSEWTRDDCLAFVAWSHQAKARRIVLRQLLAACRRAGVPLDAGQIEDLWSDLCMRLHLRIQGFDPARGRLLTYLIRGLVQSRKHGLRRRHQADVPIDDESTAKWAEEAARQELELEAKRLLDVVKSLLPNDYFKVVLAHYYLGKTTPEIAQDLGISRSLVRMRLFRARLKLRDVLDRNDWRIQ